ncbi:tetratricopeptide repeat protein [Candidatus Daviesbacteria bacterium]|nr:tetratricopeptide repeat protein [Candidatus Daviesbacteria bacterium]
MDDKKAIDAALNSRWEEALLLNQQILKENKQNVDALNRLARAYFELGDLIKSKKYYNLALKYDPYNPIAQKNLKIIKAFKGIPNGRNNLRPSPLISPSMFLQEPGKTKIVALLKVAEPAKLSQIYCGMSVLFSIKQRGISVTDTGNSYLGVLPDDLAHNLIRLIKGGNKFSALVKSVRVNGVSIMIREEKRSQRFRNQPSFLDFPVYTGDQNFSVNLKNEETPIFEEEE